jgi:hypothetical protein
MPLPADELLGAVVDVTLAGRGEEGFDGAQVDDAGFGCVAPAAAA